MTYLPLLVSSALTGRSQCGDQQILTELALPGLGSAEQRLREAAGEEGPARGWEVTRDLR